MRRLVQEQNVVFVDVHFPPDEAGKRSLSDRVERDTPIFHVLPNDDDGIESLSVRLQAIMKSREGCCCYKRGCLEPKQSLGGGKRGQYCVTHAEYLKGVTESVATLNVNAIWSQQPNFNENPVTPAEKLTVSNCFVVGAGATTTGLLHWREGLLGTKQIKVSQLVRFYDSNLQEYTEECQSAIEESVATIFRFLGASDWVEFREKIISLSSVQKDRLSKTMKEDLKKRVKGLKEIEKLNAGQRLALSLGVSSLIPGDHDLCPIPKVDGKRESSHCVICGKTVRTQCSNEACMNKTRLYGEKIFYGLGLCDPSVGIRPGKEKTCLELHRDAVCRI